MSGGLIFEKQPDGRIKVTVQPTDVVPAIFHSVVNYLDMASIMSAMCVRGESDETYKEAFELLTRK